MLKRPLIAVLPLLLMLLAGCDTDHSVFYLSTVSLSTTTLAFPNTVVGSTGNQMTLTLTNLGGGVFNYSNSSFSGNGAADFSVSSTNCTNIFPSQTCSITLVFAPTALGSVTGTMSIAGNAINSPQTVSLSGTGIGLPLTNSCGSSVVTSPTLPTPTSPYTGVAFTGSVKAGLVGIIGASVQIYAAGTTGNGSAPVAIGSALTTDVNGNFSVAAATYPYSNSVIYAVATGGKAGASGTVNAGTVLMSVLGVANGLTSHGNYTLNEATTVASAYAMAQFLKPGAKLGATPSNALGIGLAAGTVANLVNITTGAEPGTYFPLTGTAPTARINSLANLLNACIVSSGATSAACTGLYGDTTVSGTVPTNTLDAVLSLAKNPGTDVSQLYTLSQASSAYSPVLTSAPTDWTMYVTFAGGGMNDPSALGVDSLGNIWVANYFNIVSYFTNTGSPIFPTGVTGNQLQESYGGAMDNTNTFWAVDEQSSGFNGGNGSVDIFNTSGQILGELGVGGLNFPLANAFDTSANMWVVDYGDSSVSVYTTTENPLSAVPLAHSPYTSSQLVFPVAVAIDPQCNAFIANQATNTITKVIGNGSSFTSFVVGNGPSGIAVDASGNAWSANYYGNSVGLMTAQGQVLSGSTGISGGGLNHPQGIAIDGSGTAWVANYRGSSLSELAPVTATTPGAILSPSSGWGPDAQLLEAFAVAVDDSGNLWVTNFGSNTLTEFLGMAAPVKTPLLGPVRAAN
jgi:hypothetical protein